MAEKGKCPPLRSDAATLIHVYGTDRSGSTLLDLIFGHAPDAFSCGEVSAWFRPYRKHHFHIDCLCGHEPCPIWDAIKDMPEARFHAAVVAQQHAAYVIDSSKDICWLIDAQGWATAAGLRTVNLVIWKNPLDLAYSYWKRGRPASSWRKSFVSVYGRFLQIGLPFIAIHYNDLAENPAQTVEKLCTAMGMPYFPGKENFWEGDQHPLFGSAGLRQQIKAGSARIEVPAPFPTEFEKHRSEIEAQLAHDDEVQTIIQSLLAADILRGTKKNFPAPNTVLPHPLPFWYHRKKLLRLLRRYIPEHFEEIP